MARERGKSGATILLDIVKNLLALGATGVVVFFIWKWNRMGGLVAALFVYIMMLNLMGLLARPLYGLTPENRLGRKIMQSMQDGDLERAAELKAEFAERFNVNAPKDSPDA